MNHKNTQLPGCELCALYEMLKQSIKANEVYKEKQIKQSYADLLIINQPQLN